MGICMHATMKTNNIEYSYELWKLFISLGWNPGRAYLCIHSFSTKKSALFAFLCQTFATCLYF